VRNRATIVIWVIAAIALLTALVLDAKKKSRRIKQAEVTTGVITEKGKRAKGERYVAYTFSVEGKLFYGDVSIQFCKECEKSCCDIGAHVKVRYEKGNPDNNDLIH
jgi:hypothetical protein